MGNKIEKQRLVCSCCGAELDTEDYYEMQGELLCPDCYHNETVTCEHCGERIWLDDNAGSDNIDSTGAIERGLFDTSNLYAFDYRYLRNYYWDYPDPAEHEPQDVKQLKDFAASIGVNREDIDLLLCYGYFVEEIEEMLYHPGEFEQAIAEILDECAYDYCGEW